jgi:2,4-dienoyl-CoA reductase-like NADH-dependent reductase (Old Yellow Enzyme family)
MGDSDPMATFGYVARELHKRGIAFICARENLGGERLGPFIKKEFGGVFIANEQLTRESAEAVIEAGEADAVAFGKWFIANPDLPQRLAKNAPLNPARPELFYGPDGVGYTDYPALEETV